MILTSAFKDVGDIDTNAKYKTIFVYNFTKYIKWPSDYKNGAFKIGVFGETNLYSELEKMAKTKKVGNQPIEVLKFSDVSDIEKCHILYVSPKKTDQVGTILKKISKTSTLLVTESPGMIDKGAIINFVVENNKLNFELNKKAASKYKLQISTNLEALAVLVK